MGRRFAALLCASGLLCALLTGCHSHQGQPDPVQTTIFAMNTVMNLTVYGEQDALDQAVAAIYEMERQFSATDENSSIYALNHAGGEWVDMDPLAANLVASGKSWGSLTDGALDITAYPAVQAWGFPSGEYRVPDQDELARLADSIDYTQIEFNLERFRCRIPAGMEVDLGAVAKGVAGDQLWAILSAAGVKSALLDLGQSSIQAIGSKPDGTPWRIGIQDPDGTGYLGVLEISNQAVGTSGNYQRFFEEDGVRYCHIIDPNTAAPVQNGLASVTVVSSTGDRADALSTALFVMGQEDAADFWRTHTEPNFDVIFIAEDGSISITPGLKDAFTLAEEYKNREVTVLE